MRGNYGRGQPPSPTEPQPPAVGPRWARVKAVFMDALDVPESEREAFLERACEGDAALLREVASLLASERRADDYLETPAAAIVPPIPVSPGPDAATGTTPTLVPGTRLGPYEILDLIGAGGMGEVYRARDAVLGRDVAIKTVRGNATDPDARRRLLREARHAATLHHPNVCTIYEVGDTGVLPYVVMTLVKGRSLGDLVDGAPLPLGRMLDYGIQVAAALEHAHAQGIVHRDLKSSNVMVEGSGRAVVLDFGLARRLPGGFDARSADLTVTLGGALAGTLTHMAPELLLGRDAEPRSDVWSLGVLLYELATGALPFRGQTPFETSSAILADSPPPMGRHVPLALRLVVQHCLAKDPDARFQTIGEVRRALEAIRRRRSWTMVGRLLVRARRRPLLVCAAAAAILMLGARTASRMAPGFAIQHGPVSSVAFLPFEDATEDEGLAFYAAGFAGALVERLGAATDARLILPASGVSGAERAASPAAVGTLARSLGADAAVTGRLRAASDRIAVDVQLVDPETGRVFWSDTFERTPQHALALQADVVRAIAAEIRLSLRPESGQRLATTRAVNPEAYEAYLKGRFEWNRRTVESLDLAIEHFTRAVQLDPTYAPAHAALADCYNQLGTVMVGRGSPREYRPRAEAAAIRALQIDPYSAEAHAALAYVHHYDWRWEEAEAGFRRAIELNPSFALARVWYANYLMSRRRLDEAFEQVYAARELDPFSLVVNTNIAWILRSAGRSQEAVVQLERTLALDAHYPQARFRLVGALLAMDRHAEAVAQAESMAADHPSWPPAQLSLAHTRAVVGDRVGALDLLEEVLERERERYVSPWSVAAIFLAVGDIEQAVTWYGRALEERSNAVVYIPTDSAAGALQRHPRFQELVARAGLTESKTWPPGER